MEILNKRYTILVSCDPNFLPLLKLFHEFLFLKFLFEEKPRKTQITAYQNFFIDGDNVLAWLPLI